MSLFRILRLCKDQGGGKDFFTNVGMLMHLFICLQQLQNYTIECLISSSTIQSVSVVIYLHV